MKNNFGREWIILIKEKGLEYTERSKDERERADEIEIVEMTEETKLHNMKMNMKTDPMYKNFRHDITPEGLAMAFRWIPDATGLSEVDKELIVLKAREDMEEIWPMARDQREAMALFQEKTREIKDPEKLKVYLCEFLLDLSILASTWIEAQEKAGMNASAQRMFG